MANLFNTVRLILHRQFSFHHDQIQPETNFELELGVDSKEMLELIYEFELVFKIKINFDDISEIVTIEDAVNYIEKKIKAEYKF